MLIGFLCIGTLAAYLWKEEHSLADNGFYGSLFCQIAHLLAIRTGKESLFKAGLLSNVPLLFAAGLTVLLQLLTIYVPLFNTFSRLNHYH
ncbi:MAG: cation transporting ATPase C-terminal domain-containing protein [Ignavibacteria bacterium]|nr:cation transporting ATPase C-terminal domain-containing protein [Ignavibacteria bacterium]